MKFGQFMSGYKRKNLTKNTTKKFQVLLYCKLAQLLLENDIFEASYLY